MGEEIQRRLASILEKRRDEQLYRQLMLPGKGIDLYSNDYLGLARSAELAKKIESAVTNAEFYNGATGSRLLSGNSLLYQETEAFIADYHKAESALLFNSGYDANLGFFSAVPQKGDIILYDEYVHASIRDGIRLSLADAFAFRHNDIVSLQEKLNTVIHNKAGVKQVFVAIESIYSMDGDIAPLKEIASYCHTNGYNLIIDEAHANGIYGKKGEGLAVMQGIEKDCFARLYTFGKALGVHGAAITGSRILCEYMVNFCRPFIYTTALPPHSVISIRCAYEMLPDMDRERSTLRELSGLFASNTGNASIDSPIHTIKYTGNEKAKNAARLLQEKGYELRPILSPTVPKGSERIRVCLHSYNTIEEIAGLCNEIRDIEKD